MPSRLKRLISPTDTEAQRFGKLTESIVERLPGDVRPQVIAFPSDTVAIAEEKWQRAVTESLAEVQVRIAAGGGGQYVHYQGTPSAVWEINHNLGGYPAVAVVDSAGNVGFGAVTYLSTQSLRVEFASGFSGRAYLVL